MTQSTPQKTFIRRQNFMMRLFFESNFLLSLGFVAVLILQTLWIIARTQVFSIEKTPILFRNSIIISFACAIACFGTYLIFFYFFAITNRLSWNSIRKTLFAICGSIFITLAIAQLSVIRVIKPSFLLAIKPDRMFIYFFPILVVTTFIGITTATTFMLRFRQDVTKPKTATPKTTTSAINVENKEK